MNVSEILNKIGVSIIDLAVSSHEMGFASIGVLIKDGTVVDAEITYSVNEVYYDGEWEELLCFGTGHEECGCEACLNGYKVTDIVKDSNNIKDMITERLKGIKLSSQIRGLRF